MDIDRFFIAKGINLAEVQCLEGGDINQVFRYSDSVFKFNRSSDFPKMFEKEALGLEFLSKQMKTPEVRKVGQFEDLQYLEMSFEPQEEKNAAFWNRFGHDLAALHRVTNTHFGFETDNYIGSLRQSNNHQTSWSEFLVLERLQPMIEMAVNSGEVNYVEAKVIEHFYRRIEELFPNEPPALIHGDLWNGNYICGKNGRAVLIDPAVYFGHREMDIGMMHLFGGFDERLMNSYNEVYPLQTKWTERLKYSQLYPLLVHVNLFGRSYRNQVATILQPFSV